MFLPIIIYKLSKPNDKSTIYRQIITNGEIAKKKKRRSSSRTRVQFYKYYNFYCFKNSIYCYDT